MIMFGKHVTRDLSAYCHGELAPAERLRLETHLNQCSKCRAALHEIRSGVRLASALKLTRAPESIWTGMRNSDFVYRRRRLRITMLPIAAIAAALIVAVIVVMSVR